jgi:hypothetical protein
MIPMARGQAIEMRGNPMTHALWLDDAEHDSGERAVVALCGVWACPEDVEETDALIDCMACLVDPRRYWDER